MTSKLAPQDRSPVNNWRNPPKEIRCRCELCAGRVWTLDQIRALPQLRPTLMVVTTLQVIAGLKVFVPIYVLTSGGPANASLSLYFLVFQKINQYKLAYATTVGWVFTSIVTAFAIITAVAFRVRRDDA